MTELNKDGLEAGKEVDFSTLMRINKLHEKGGKDEQAKPTAKPATGRPSKPSVPNVPKAKEQKKA
jgi:hypothetical protein